MAAVDGVRVNAALLKSLDTSVWAHVVAMCMRRVVDELSGVDYAGALP